MPEIPALTFLNFFVYLSIPFIFAALAKWFKLSPVVGYMIGGVVIGNLTNTLIDQEIIRQYAFLGIILLLFTVGLEINFSRMLTLKKFIIIGGFFQLIFSIAVIAILSGFFGFTMLQSFLIGIALSSSSTALIAKIIQDRGEEGSFLGELIMGILMFQDLAFIPFLIIFNSITSGDLSFFQLAQKLILDIVISCLIIWIMFYLGRKIIPVVFSRISNLSRELLNFFIIIFILAIAFISSLFNIPILVGVFIAGVLVSQTSEHYHIFSRLRPLRDILAIIFFIYIGSNVLLTDAIPSLPQILLFSVLVVTIKAVIIFGLFVYMRFSTRISFYTSVSLFQIDEDAFILMFVALSNNIFSQSQYVFIVSSTFLSLILTPILVKNKEVIYFKIKNFIDKRFPKLGESILKRVDLSISPIDVLKIRNHVIICGYGRVGSTVGRALSLASVPFIAVDYNFHTTEKAKKDGVEIIYGDPTDIDVLDYVECDNAIALVCAVPSKFDQESVIINARKLNPNIFIISRVQSNTDHQRLKDLGAQAIVQPELEASISIIKKIFLLKKIPKEEIIKSLKHLKLIHGAV